MKKIKIIQVKSSIGYRKRTKATLEALGLRKINHFVLIDATEPILGMINSVSHLVKIEEVK